MDDLNDWSGCLGNYPHVSTPHIDGLASRGIIFKNAHCQAPICAPSRASVYTGINPHSTGIYYQLHDKEIRLSSGIAAEAVYLPDFFEESGYKSFGVGKLFHDGDAAGVYDVYGGIFPEMGFGPKPDETDELRSPVVLGNPRNGNGLGSSGYGRFRDVRL